MTTLYRFQLRWNDRIGWRVLDTWSHTFYDCADYQSARQLRTHLESTYGATR